MTFSKPRQERWSSIKLGDSVVLPNGVLTLVSERRFKQKWSEHSRIVYWRKGLLLNLVTGKATWWDMDDCVVRGEIVKVTE